MVYVLSKDKKLALFFKVKSIIVFPIIFKLDVELLVSYDDLIILVLLCALQVDIISMLHRGVVVSWQKLFDIGIMLLVS